MRETTTRNARVIALTAAVVVSFSALPSRSAAGEWHLPGQIVCSDCHTMHNSADGVPMRYDGNPTPGLKLLRGPDPIGLCLYCHDGSKPEAPSVLGPITYVDDAAGGFFSNRGGQASSTSHNIGVAGVTPYPGGPTMKLTCVSCHAPHGNSNYRNLRPNPSGSGAPAITVIASSFLYPSNQRVTANGSNAAQVYASSSIVYASGMTQWCNDCHAGSDPSAHTVDRAIWGSTLADYAGTWNVGGDRLMVPVPSPNGTEYVRRVPVQNPSDTSIPSTDDRLFCLSCHKAHGSANPKAQLFADVLVGPGTWMAGSTIDNTCQQCHNQ